MNTLPVLKNTRLAARNYIGYQNYFVTLCVFRREHVFSDSGRSRNLLGLLEAEGASRNFKVHAYCLMPDHLHFFAEGIEPNSDPIATRERLQNQEQQTVRVSRGASALAAWLLRAHSSFRRKRRVGRLVYLAESCSQTNGFESSGLSFLRVVQWHEDAGSLECSWLAAALEVARERPASEGGPYKRWNPPTV
jgi:REP element-mobilizing transposase RayT